MSTPVATIADALIAFILSLLSDPDASAQFESDPDAMLRNNGLEDVCEADVRGVAPVVVDHPTVTPKPPVTPGDHNYHHDPVVKEIVRLTHQFTTVDARSTIIDQSVNQNIWTEGGDVTQVFDQEAIVASGDGSVAAGDDGAILNTDTDITTGDIAVGNTSNDDSFNHDHSTDIDGTIEGSFIDNSVVDASSGAASEDDSTGSGVSAAADAVAPAPAPAVPEPADVLESDMTSGGDSYESSTDSGTMPEAPVFEEPVQES